MSIEYIVNGTPKKPHFINHKGSKTPKRKQTGQSVQEFGVPPCEDVNIYFGTLFELFVNPFPPTAKERQILSMEIKEIIKGVKLIKTQPQT